MTKDKLRLLLLDDCNRNCPGCCNRDWDLQALPLCQDYTPYRLIMLTGGEPMLYPEIIREAIAAIRRQTNVPIYLYTVYGYAGTTGHADATVGRRDGDASHTGGYPGIPVL